MATNYDATTLTGFINTEIQHLMGAGRSGTIRIHIDFAALNTALSTTGIASGDTLDILDIPIGAQIHGVLQNVLTKGTVTGTQTATVSVGDATAAAHQTPVSAAGYMAATTILTVGKTGTVIGDAYAPAKVYSVAHVLQLTFAGGFTLLTAGVIEYYVNITLMDVTALKDITWH